MHPGERSCPEIRRINKSCHAERSRKDRKAILPAQSKHPYQDLCPNHVRHSVNHHGPGCPIRLARCDQARRKSTVWSNLLPA